MLHHKAGMNWNFVVVITGKLVHKDDRIRIDFAVDFSGDTESMYFSIV